MTSISQVDVNANLDERLAIWQTVRTQLDATGHKLLERLDQLHGEALVAESDRILAIAGRLCMQFEAPDLFRRIYATALDGCQLAPGDELRFLRGEPCGTQPSTASAPVVTTLRDGQDQPLQVVVGGVFFSREHDQDQAWRDVREDAIRRQLRGLSGDGVCALADELVDLAWSSATEEQDELLGAIGWILVTNGRQDLWRLVYLKWDRGSSYVVGDEVRFLLKQPAADGTPLRDEGAA